MLRTRTWPALSIAALLALAVPAAADPLADLVAGRTAAAPELAGLAVVTADRHGVRSARAYGRAVIDAGDVARERPLTPATPIRVASVSKLAVAIVVMRLVEVGSLDLDRDVSDYLGWRVRNPAFPDTALTLRQLLSHTSGLDDASGYSFPLGARLQDGLTPDHWSAAPGARFSYANINFGIIATVMEAATATRFDRLMTAKLFAPLHLDACFNWSGCSSDAVAHAAVLYRKGRDEQAWNPVGPWIAQVDDLRGIAPPCPVRAAGPCDLDGYRPGDNGTLFSPQGGMRISPLGLATLGRLLLRGGEVDGVRLLHAPTVAAMLRPQWHGGPGGNTYAGLMTCYGLSVLCLNGLAAGRDQPVAGRTVRWNGHLGEAYGVYSGLWIDRRRGRVFIYAVTGMADDPARFPGVFSAFHRFEEAVMTILEAGL